MPDSCDERLRLVSLSAAQQDFTEGRRPTLLMREPRSLPDEAGDPISCEFWSRSTWRRIRPEVGDPHWDGTRSGAITRGPGELPSCRRHGPGCRRNGPSRLGHREQAPLSPRRRLRRGSMPRPRRRPPPRIAAQPRHRPLNRGSPRELPRGSRQRDHVRPRKLARPSRNAAKRDRVGVP